MLASAGPSRLGEDSSASGPSGPADTRVRDVLDRAAERAERELRATTPVLAAVEHTIGETYFALGLFEAGGSARARGLAASQGLRDPGPRAEAYMLLSMILQRTGRYGEALEASRKEVAIARDVNGTESADYAIALQNEAAILGSKGTYAEADSVLALAMKVGQASMPAGDPRLSRSRTAWRSVSVGRGASPSAIRSPGMCSRRSRGSTAPSTREQHSPCTRSRTISPRRRGSPKRRPTS
jgi:hypothetical protein